MATFRTIIDTIKELAATKPNLGFITSPNIYELNAQQSVNYPAFVLTPQTHSYEVDDDKMVWNFYLFLVDRLTEDRSNEEQVQSWAISELKSMINELEEMGYLPVYEYQFTTFTERFESLAAGAYVNLRLAYPLNECDYKSIFEILKELFQKELENKQDKLVSGVNIKTVNGNSLLGSGNIEIQGGEGFTNIVAGDGIVITEEDDEKVISVDRRPHVLITYTDGTVKADYFDNGEIPSSYYKGRTDIKKIEIEKDIKQVKSYAFSACTNIETVVFDSDDTIIGSGLFVGCSSLKKVKLPENIDNFPTRLFGNCTSITSVGGKGSGADIEIPDKVNMLNNYVFVNCTSLTSVTIPKTLTSFAAYVFNNCSNLSNITFYDTLISLGQRSSFEGLPTEGTLTCNKEWFDGLSSKEIYELANVYNWDKVWLDETLEQRVSNIERMLENINEMLKG